MLFLQNIMLYFLKKVFNNMLFSDRILLYEKYSQQYKITSQ